MTTENIYSKDNKYRMKIRAWTIRNRILKTIGSSCRVYRKSRWGNWRRCKADKVVIDNCYYIDEGQTYDQQKTKSNRRYVKLSIGQFGLSIKIKTDGNLIPTGEIRPGAGPQFRPVKIVGVKAHISAEFKGQRLTGTVSNGKTS